MDLKNMLKSANIKKESKKKEPRKVAVTKREGACELKLLALNSSRSSHASAERPFSEFANPIFASQKDRSLNE